MKICPLVPEKKIFEGFLPYTDLFTLKHTFQTDYDGLAHTVDLFQKLRCKKPKPASVTLPQLREDGVKIARAKYIDLVRLCSSKIIPSVHHTFYLP